MSKRGSKTTMLVNKLNWRTSTAHGSSLNRLSHERNQHKKNNNKSLRKIYKRTKKSNNKIFDNILSQNNAPSNIIPRLKAVFGNQGISTQQKIINNLLPLKKTPALNEILFQIDMVNNGHMSDLLNNNSNIMNDYSTYVEQKCLLDCNVGFLGWLARTLNINISFREAKVIHIKLHQNRKLKKEIIYKLLSGARISEFNKSLNINTTVNETQ